MFREDPREVSIPVVAINVAHELLEPFGSLDCIEMVHFEAA
jgi:hypothetical protein